MYNKYPKNSVRECLLTQILAATKNSYKIIHHFIRLYSGLIAVAQHQSDMNCVSYCVEKIVILFEEEVSKAIEEHDNEVGGNQSFLMNRRMSLLSILRLLSIFSYCYVIFIPMVLWVIN